MLELNKSNFEKEIKSNKTLVIDLWAEWCGPCKAMEPVLEELSKEMKGITFAKLNVDQNSDIASRLGVMSIPTFIVFKDGKETGRIIGANPKSVIKAKLEAASKK